MKLRYMVVDQNGRLDRVTRASVDALWDGRLRAEDLGCPAGREVRLVSVVCDRRLVPQKVYLLRLPVTDGRFTLEDQLTLHLYSRSDCVTPREATAHHGAGWPRDLRRQLAVALDVPLAGLDVPFEVGGLSSFGEDGAGNLYVVQHGGRVWRIASE